MKKLYFTSAVILFSTFTSTAQIKKGSLLLGGNLGGTTVSYKDNGALINKQNGINISAALGTAVKDNLIVGGNMSFNSSKNKYTGTPSESKQKGYGAGFFIRKYKSIKKSDFYIFIQGGLEYGFSEFESKTQPSSAQEVTGHTISVIGYPGISYALSKKFHIESGFNNLVNISYFSNKTVTTGAGSNTTRGNGFSINTSLNNLSNLYLGFRLLFNK